MSHVSMSWIFVKLKGEESRDHSFPPPFLLRLEETEVLGLGGGVSIFS